MKNTREITTGAMLLAIFGAVLFINRQLSLLFLEIIVLLISISIIIYGNKYCFKDGLIFSVALFIISFVLSPEPLSLYYYLIGIIAGNTFNFLIKRGANSFTILLAVMAIFSIAELINIFVISSIFYGQTFYQIIIEYSDLLKEMLNSFKDVLSIDSINNFINNIVNDEFIGTMIVVACVIIGIMEGFIVYIASSICFKRFNINAQLGFSRMMNLKPTTAYVLFILSCLIFINRVYHNPIISPIIICISIVSMFILAYYGYIFVLIYLRNRFGKNSLLLIVLLIFFGLPVLFIILFIIGFLYGAGPLKKLLMAERKQNEQN